MKRTQLYAWPVKGHIDCRDDVMIRPDMFKGDTSQMNIKRSFQLYRLQLSKVLTSISLVRQSTLLFYVA